MTLDIRAPNTPNARYAEAGFYFNIVGGIFRLSLDEDVLEEFSDDESKSDEEDEEEGEEMEEYRIGGLVTEFPYPRPSNKSFGVSPSSTS